MGSRKGRCAGRPNDVIEEGFTKYIRDGEAFLEADFVGARDPTALFVISYLTLFMQDITTQQPLTMPPFVAEAGTR
jgi:hypothetical protein